jgi:hypothetical protein
MNRGATQSRRNRRGQFRAMGYLKFKNMFGRFSPQAKSWYDKIATDGKEAHETFVNRVNDSIGDQLQTKLNSLKSTWESIGYNESEIKLLEEAWSLTVIKDKETYRKDKKDARKLQREAQESLKSRLNADS